MICALFHLKTDKFGYQRTKTDINGHWRFGRYYLCIVIRKTIETFHPPFVIQSEAKDLGNIHVDAHEILRRCAPLDDKGWRREAKDHKLLIFNFHFLIFKTTKLWQEM